jgi:hypothetical protein
MITMITTTMMTMTMTARNVRTHTHRLSLTDGPRECEQARIASTSAKRAKEEYLRRGAPLGTPSSATNSVPLPLVLFSWGAWEAGHVNYRPGADRCSVAGTNPRRCVSPPSDATRLRGSVLRGSGWFVPCVSIQLTLSQTPSKHMTSRPIWSHGKGEGVTGSAAHECPSLPFSTGVRRG